MLKKQKQDKSHATTQPVKSSVITGHNQRFVRSQQRYSTVTTTVFYGHTP